MRSGALGVQVRRRGPSTVAVNRPHGWAREARAAPPFRADIDYGRREARPPTASSRQVWIFKVSIDKAELPLSPMWKPRSLRRCRANAPPPRRGAPQIAAA